MLLTCVLFAYFAIKIHANNPNLIPKPVCNNANGLKCEQGPNNDCAPGDGPLDLECIANGGQCEDTGSSCTCEFEEGKGKKACDCTNGACVDLACASAHESTWECLPNAASECRCESPCKPPKGYKGCPPDNCLDCRPCRDVDADNSKRCITVVQTSRGLVRTCSYYNARCIYEECCPPLDWELCDANNCNGCMICEDEPKTVCPNVGGKCVTATGGRCIRKYKINGVEAICTVEEGIATIWKFVISDYIAPGEQNMINGVRRKYPRRTNVNAGDYYEEYFCKQWLVRKYISDADREKICGKCSEWDTDDEQLLCLWREVTKKLDDKKFVNCHCKHHACVIWWMLKNDGCFDDKFKDKVEIIAKTIKGDPIGHAFVCVDYTEEYQDDKGVTHDKECRAYLDSLDVKQNATVIKCCQDKGPKPAPAPVAQPTFIPTAIEGDFDLSGPSPYCVASACDENCTYILVDDPKTRDDADEYCIENYGTGLATIADELHMAYALPLIGDLSVWIGIENTHKSGWWVHSDGTLCENEYGACVDAFLWKDGHPQKTCELHPGSWCVTLYPEAYMDNTEGCEVEKPFLCNCS